MTPLQRQLMRSYSAAFCAALFIMTAAVLAFDAAKILLQKGLTPGMVVAALPYLVPSVARTAAQGAVLFAVCYVYGRMAARNELLALNASGISVFGVIWPVVAIGIPLSLCCVGLEDLAATWGKNGIRRIVCDGIVDIVYSQLASRRSFHSDDYELTVDGVDGRRLVGPTVLRRSTETNDGFLLQAVTGRLAWDERAERLRVILERGALETQDGLRMSFADELEYSIPINEEPGQAESWERVQAQQHRVENLAARRSAMPSTPPWRNQAAMSIPTADLHGDAQLIEVQRTPNPEAIRLTAAEQPQPLLEDFEAQLRREEGELHWRRALWHQKWANSFCCLTFTLVGIPTAVRFRRSDYLSSFMACFLPVLAVYQPLQFFGMALATRGEISPWWLHVNNGLFAAFGIFCLARLTSRS